MTSLSDLDTLPGNLEKELAAIDITTCNELALKQPESLSMQLTTDSDTLETYISHARNAALSGRDFSTATNIEHGTDLSSLDIPESVAGWQLSKNTTREARWSTPSGYCLRITGNQTEVKGHLPAIEDDETEPSQMVRYRVISQHPDDPPQHALDTAIEWLENHPLPELDTDQLDGIGARTAEYFWFKHGITDEKDLAKALNNNTIALSQFVGDDHAEEIQAEIQ